MHQVIETEVHMTKVIIELDMEEARGLQELLWHGVGQGTLEKLNLKDLADTLHGHMNLRGIFEPFTESAHI